MKSAQVSVVREVRRVVPPGGVRCALCKLFAGTDRDGVASIYVRYNGDDGLPENPLCALTRHKHVCNDCVAALRGADPAAAKPARAVTPDECPNCCKVCGYCGTACRCG